MVATTMIYLELELKQWALSDAKELTNLCNAVDRHYLSDRLPNPYTEKDAEEWLKMVTDNNEINGIYRAIVCDGKLIGSISVEKKDDDAEIGYMILNGYSNKGIGTEAVRLEQITANVFQPNIASIRVLQKNGFKHKDTLPNAVIKDGYVYDLLIYVLNEKGRR